VSLVARTEAAGVLTRVMGVSDSSGPHSHYRRGYSTAAVIDRGIWSVNHIHIRDIMPPQGQHMGFAKVVMALSLSDGTHPSNTASTK
jgi:hypothetical protein